MAYRDMRGALAASIAVCAVAVSSPAWAQSKQINVPAQTAATGIPELARQADIQILVSESAVRGKTTKAVRGTMTADQALRRLIAGTGLRIVSNDGRTYTLSTSGAADTSREEIQTGALSGDAVGDQAGSVETSEIIVTAQKREERLLKVPISISVLRGAAVDRSTDRNVTDVLKRVPGVSLEQGAFGGSLSLNIRGVSAGRTQFAGGSAVGYYVDAVPFGFVKSSYVPDTSGYDLERIEVLRGPQGTLYGASSLNGVVRVLTSDPDLSNFDFKGRASIADTKGGDQSYRGDMAVNLPIVEGKLAARAVVGYQRVGGWIDQPVRQNVNDGDLTNIRLKIKAQPTDALTLGASYWLARNDYGARDLSDLNYRDGPRGPDSLRSRLDAYGFNIDYEFAAFTLSSNTSYVDYEQVVRLDQLPPGLRFLDTAVRSKVFSQEVLLNSVGDGPWTWSVGGFYRDASDDLFQFLPTLPAPIDFTDKSKSYALFGQVSRKLFDDAVELTAGLRYFRDEVSQIENFPSDGNLSRPLVRSSDIFKAWSPRLVLTWYPTEKTTLYASYSKGFRSGFNQNPNVLVTFPSFPPVNPDKLYNYEFGSKGSFLGGSVSYDAAVYYIDWKDIQQPLTVPFAGTQIAALVNAQSASGIGAELSVSARPVSGLDLTAYVSYNGLEFDDDVFSGGILLFEKGDRLNISPKFTYGASLDYLFPMGSSGFSGRLSTSVNHVSPKVNRTISAGASVPTFSDPTTFVRASFAIKAPRNWEVSFFVENLTNKRSIVTASRYNNLFELARPRTVGIQLEYALN